METRAFETSLGPIWLRGEPEAFTGSRPVVLAIAGAFAEEGAFDELALRLPQAAVMVGQLPGNHCPPLAATSIGAFAAAYDQAIGRIGRPTIICGSSIGGLVALALREPAIRGLVLLDPPMRTAGLWPLIPRLQALLRAEPEAHVVDLIGNVFGVSTEAVEDRDYLGLLDRLRTPTWCLFGEAPLQPPRALAADPSFVDEPERAILRAHPAIRTQVAPGVGHNLQGYAGGLVLAAIRFFLDRLAAET